MLQTASLMGFIRTILIILLVYYGVKILVRFFTPYLIKYMSSKVKERFGGQFQQQARREQPQNEGETVIDKVPRSNKNSNEKVGEYVDFEEID